VTEDYFPQLYSKAVSLIAQVNYVYQSKRTTTDDTYSAAFRKLIDDIFMLVDEIRQKSPRSIVSHVNVARSISLKEEQTKLVRKMERLQARQLGLDSDAERSLIKFIIRSQDPENKQVLVQGVGLSQYYSSTNFALKPVFTRRTTRQSWCKRERKAEDYK
jgi:hypothetical protein